MLKDGNEAGLTDGNGSALTLETEMTPNLFWSALGNDARVWSAIGEIEFDNSQRDLSLSTTRFCFVAKVIENGARKKVSKTYQSHMKPTKIG